LSSSPPPDALLIVAPGKKAEAEMSRTETGGRNKLKEYIEKQNRGR